MKIEKVLGLHISVRRSIPPSLFDELSGHVRPDAAELMRQINTQHGYNPNDYHVYIHRLEFTSCKTLFQKERKVRFLNDIPLPDRIGSLVIGYYVNQKQKKNKGIELCNYWYKWNFPPHDLYATPIRSRYFAEGAEIINSDFSPRILISLVHQNVPLRHRKIKLRIMARISDQALTRLPTKFHKRLVSELDIKLEQRTDSIGSC